MNLKKYSTVLENSISLFLLKVIDLGLTIWMIPYLIYKVGLNNYGVYAFAMSLVLFFVNILNYGFNLSTVREIAKNSRDNAILNKIFNEVFNVKLLLYLGLSVLFYLLVLCVPKFSQYFRLYFYCSLLLFSDLFSLRWFFYGIEKMKYITIASFIGISIYAVLVLIFIDKPSDFINIPLFESIGMATVTIVTFVLVLQTHQFKIRFLPLIEIVNYLKNNFSSFINLMLPSTYNTTIVFLVGLLGAPIHVGVMQIGVKITAVFSTVNTILTTVFYPIVNRHKKLIVPTRFVINCIGGFLSLIMCFFAEFLIINWIKFSNSLEIQNTISVVRILSPIPLLMGLISSYGIHGLLSGYKDLLFSKITFLSTFAMVVLAFVLVPRFEVFGGAVAFLIGRVLYAVLSMRFYSKSH